MIKMNSKVYAAYAEMAACQKTRLFQEEYRKKHGGNPVGAQGTTQIIREAEPKVDVKL